MKDNHFDLERELQELRERLLEDEYIDLLNYLEYRLEVIKGDTV